MGKQEIVHHEQFLLLSQYFQKTHENQDLFGKGIKTLRK